MAVYLIDFENVTSAGISGIQRLTKEDKVYIFYTVNASNMSFAAHLNLLSSPAEVIYYNVTSGGKNALDFHLASFLGYLISKGEDKNFCIISNDKGYDHVKSFWERNGLSAGITINSSPSINRALLPAERPFTSKIQQTVIQHGIPQEQLKTAEMSENANSANNASEEKTEETASEKTEISTEIKSAEFVSNEAPSTDEVMEKKPAKRRGRPKSKKTEIKQTAEANTANAENTVKSGNKAKASQNANTAKNSKNLQNNDSAKSANNLKKSKKEQVPDTVSQSVKNAAARAVVSSEKEISGILELLKSADGKQQFYRGLLKIFGMERGVEVYKAVRPEYTNLSKLVR